MDWTLLLERFVEYLQRERRVGSGAQRQYRIVVEDWIEFSLDTGRDPAVFDQAAADRFLDRRARRNRKGTLSLSSRLGYTANLRVFCNWASGLRRDAGHGGIPQSLAPASGSISSVPPALRHRDESAGRPASLPRPSDPGQSSAPSAQLWIESWQGPLPAPITALERLLEQGGTTIVRAAFQHSFFAHPDAVRHRTPWYPDRARTSREHYPGRERGDLAQWKGRSVRLGDNGYAQLAWQKYTERRIERGSGFGVRHIWGNPWDPDAFTAGWNLCYMPFWAGMLTERQHPHPKLEAAVRQAAWDLYFRNDPVCEPPDCVDDPGIDLRHELGTQPIFVLRPMSR